MGNIVLLDDLTINKIAAGEVVERPASVVKELVENSIDAGATNISIEIKNGGISYIRITDNGKGIAADDMEIAFERHATSKIRQAEDLNSVKSMGFRGEALASVAAIANVEMSSKQWEENIGNRIVVEAGNVLEKGETGCPAGTTITVKNLFFNTPVRYKFLKKDYTEAGYIEDAITRLALVNPDISFKLVNSGKVIIKTYGDGNLNNVIYSIFGKDIASKIVDVNYKFENITVKGVVGKPEIARSNRSNQLFFVNKRFVKDKTLSGASEQAFKEMLPTGKYGFLVLNIEVEPSMVDVNVHPAKLEVRFQEEGTVFKAVYHAIKDSLLKSELVKNVKKEKEEKMEMMELIVPEEKKGFGSFFGKNKNKKEDWEIEEPIDENNHIANIFNSKQKQKNNKNIFKDYEEEYEEEKIEEPEKIETRVAETTASYMPQNNIQKDMNLNINTNVLEKIAMLQKQVSEDLEKNPNIVFDRNRLEDEKRKLDALRNNETKLFEKEDTINKAQAEEIKEITKEENETEREQFLEKNNKEQNEIQDDIITVQEETSEIDEEQEKEQVTEQTIVEENENVEAENNIKEIIEEKKDEEFDKKIEKMETVEESENENIVSNNQILQSSDDFDAMYAKIFGRTLNEAKAEKAKQEVYVDDIVKVEKNDNYSIFENRKEYNKEMNYKFIGIAFSTYIIIEIKKELYIIDQHAAHERIMYEKIKNNFYSDSEKDSQMLLLPDIINLSYKEMDIVRDNWSVFEKAGFELEDFGENTIKLTGVPEVCFDLDTKELFLETLDEINTVARNAKKEIEEKFIATIACKVAEKANMALKDEEVKDLLEELLSLPNPFTCPHGKPTAIKMNKFDLEKKFSRRK